MFEGLGLILTVMIGGFTLLFALLLVLWHHFNNRFDQIKTILHMKDCCMIKDDRQMKKAE